MDKVIFVLILKIFIYYQKLRVNLLYLENNFYCVSNIILFIINILPFDMFYKFIIILTFLICFDVDNKAEIIPLLIFER